MTLEYILLQNKNEIARVPMNKKKKHFEKNMSNLMSTLMELGISEGQVKSLSTNSEDVSIVGKEDLIICGSMARLNSNSENAITIEIKALLVNSDQKKLK